MAVANAHGGQGVDGAPLTKVRVPALRVGESAMSRAELLDEFLSLNGLAQRWSCSRSTALRICKRRSVPVFYLSGEPRGLVRIRLEDIVKLEQAAKAT